MAQVKKLADLIKTQADAFSILRSLFLGFDWRWKYETVTSW